MLWISPWFLFKDAVENTKSVDVETVVKYLQNSKRGVKTSKATVSFLPGRT